MFIDINKDKRSKEQQELDFFNSYSCKNKKCQFHRDMLLKYTDFVCTSHRALQNTGVEQQMDAESLQRRRDSFEKQLLFLDSKWARAFRAPALVNMMD